METPAISGPPDGPASALKSPVLTPAPVESADSPELERLAVLAAHTDNSFIFTDVDRRIQWVNSAFCRMTGYAFEEVLGKSPGALLQGPDTDQATVERMRRALNSERSFREEILNYRKNGEPYWVSMEILPQRDGSGRLSGYVSIESEVSERRSREAELQNLRLAVEQSPTSIVITNTSGEIEFVNPAFEAATGYTASEVVGKNPRVLKSGEQSPDFYRELWATISSGRVWRGILHNRRKDGSLFWESASIAPVLDARGKIRRYIAVKEDISELRQTAERLERTNRRLSNILNAAREISIISCRSDGIIDLFNKGAENLTGYTAEEMVGKCTPALLHPRSEIEARCAEFAMRLGRPVSDWEAVLPLDGDNSSGHREWTLLRKDGTTRRVSVVPSIVRDEDGHVTGYLGIGTDVTERARVEEQLRQSEDLLDRTGALAGIGGWELDLATNTPRWTRQTRRLHEVDDQFVVTLDAALSFYPPEAHPPLLEAMDFAIKLGKSFDLELPFVTAKGRRIWVRCFGEPEFEDGRVVRLIGAIQDITERKRLVGELVEARNRAESANLAKSQFLANMSHEIRTPLNAILGMSELLEHDPTGPDSREYLQTIRTSGDTLLALISDVLDFSKIEAGQLELERIPVDLRSCVESAVHIVSVPAAEKGLQLDHRIDPDVPIAIQGDPTRLRQILVNLLANAVKFTDAGKIVVSVSRCDADARLRFSVADTGIGISQEQREKLFHMFSQLDASTTRRFGGTGLGLAISKRLVEMMSGRIWVESVPGTGSTFFFELPVESTEAPTQSPKHALPPSAKGHLATRCPLSILVAEDNPVNQRLIGLMLKRLGYDSRVVANGREVLEALREAPTDVILMDLQMPVMDGLTTARRICTRYSRRNRPQMIALTANAMDADREMCLEAGMDAYLSKPVRGDQLAGALEAAFLRAEKTRNHHPA